VEEGPSARWAVGEEVTRGAIGKGGPRVGRVTRLPSRVREVGTVWLFGTRPGFGGALTMGSTTLTQL
jgi:hypothetical protein